MSNMYMTSHFDTILDEYLNIFKFERPRGTNAYIGDGLPFGPTGIMGFASGEKGHITVKGYKILSFELPSYETLEDEREDDQDTVHPLLMDHELEQLCRVLGILAFKRMSIAGDVTWFAQFDHKALDTRGDTFGSFVTMRDACERGIKKGLVSWDCLIQSTPRARKSAPSLRLKRAHEEDKEESPSKRARTEPDPAQ
jgi:hypothetical protein